MIWISEAIPPTDLPVLLWHSFGNADQHPETISLPRFIEENADEIRSRLLAFLCDIRFVRHGDRTLEEALDTTVGLSMWWLSFPSLKQWGARFSMPIACRLIAIEMIVGPNLLSKLSITCDDQSLRRVVELALGRQSTFRVRVQDFCQSFRQKLRPLRAVITLVRYVFVLRSIQESGITRNESKIAFFDFLALSNLSSDTSPTYVSPFWGLVPDSYASPSWYYIYPTNVKRRGIMFAKKKLLELNEADGRARELFQQNISVKNFRILLSTFIQQLRTHARFKRVLRNFQESDSELRLWPIFEDEWNESITGSTAIRHLILLFTTEQLVSEMPEFDRVFYLLENQPWELALIHCVSKHQKGELIGVAHSTIRFWDLRYFMDPRENSLINPQSSRPLPTRILTNGEHGTLLLRQAGFPETAVSVVEALRYSHLADLRNSINPENGVVLLLGDFLEHANDNLVRIFRGAYDSLASKPKVQVRSHPICPLTRAQLGPLADSISPLPLETLLTNASVVVTTAASSSAAEAAVLGIPTIIVLNAHTLNYSPFRNSTDVYAIENSAQLKKLLAGSLPLEATPLDGIFNLDRSFPRWRAELSG